MMKLMMCMGLLKCLGCVIMFNFSLDEKWMCFGWPSACSRWVLELQSRTHARVPADTRPCALDSARARPCARSAHGQVCKGARPCVLRDTAVCLLFSGNTQRFQRRARPDTRPGHGPVCLGTRPCALFGTTVCLSCTTMCLAHTPVRPSVFPEKGRIGLLKVW